LGTELYWLHRFYGAPLRIPPLSSCIATGCRRKCSIAAVAQGNGRKNWRMFVVTVSMFHRVSAHTSRHLGIYRPYLSSVRVSSRAAMNIVRDPGEVKWERSQAVYHAESMVMWWARAQASVGGIICGIAGGVGASCCPAI
jgi:hypothetical protein